MKNNYLLVLLMFLTSGCNKMVLFSLSPSEDKQITAPRRTPINLTIRSPQPPPTIDPRQIQGGIELPPPPPPPSLQAFDSDLPFYMPLIQLNKPTMPSIEPPAWHKGIPESSNTIDLSHLKGSSPPPPPPPLRTFDSDLPFYMPLIQFNKPTMPSLEPPAWHKGIPESSNTIDLSHLKGSSPPPPPSPAWHRGIPEYTSPIDLGHLKSSPLPPLWTFDSDLPFYMPLIQFNKPTMPSLEPPDWYNGIPEYTGTIDLSHLEGNLPPPPPSPPPPQIVQERQQHELRETFVYTFQSDIFYQPRLDKNKTTLSFKAYDGYGFNRGGLQSEDLILTENQVRVENYTLSSHSETESQGLDLVFLINVSGSMRRDINLIKENIAHLIYAMDRSYLHARLCLVTFRDHVDKTCKKFVTDDPLTPQNENLIAFLDEISKLELRGGGGGRKENALAGLLASAQNTPWKIGHQRIIVLATDAQFWNRIDPRLSNIIVPSYENVLSALTTRNIQVFTMTYDYMGFSKNYFSQQSSVVEATGGQWFDLKKLRDKEITIEAIVQQIKNQFHTIYTIEYFVDDNMGLNPTLSLEERDIDIASSHSNSDIRIERQNVHSNMPYGRPEPQLRWLLDTDQHLQNVYVTINGQEEHGFFIEDGYIIFNQPPQEGSEIYVTYESGDLIDNVKWHPLVLQVDSSHPSAEIEITNGTLYLNGQLAKDSDFTIEPSASGHFHLRLDENVFSNEDPFGIRQSGHLEISFLYEVLSKYQVPLKGTNGKM